MLWTFNGVHLVFIYVPIHWWMLLNLWKPCIMFPFNLLRLFLHLSFLWKWHLLYLCTLPTCLYQCWHYRWCHSPLHHLLSPCFCALMFSLNPWSWGPPSSTLFFFLRAFLGDYVVVFLLFSNDAYISFLVFLTLACGFYGFAFWWTNR